MDVLKSEVVIPTSQLIDTKRGNSSKFSQGSIYLCRRCRDRLLEYVHPTTIYRTNNFIDIYYCNNKCHPY